MPSNSDKWIRSVKDNPAGKVVADPEGNRWEWQSDEETARLLGRLENADLAIERTDLHRTPPQGSAERDAKAGRPQRDSERRAEVKPQRPLRPGARDAGGGFNPYDHSGRPKRR